MISLQTILLMAPTPQLMGRLSRMLAMPRVSFQMTEIVEVVAVESGLLVKEPEADSRSR